MRLAGQMILAAALLAGAIGLGHEIEGLRSGLTEARQEITLLRLEVNRLESERQKSIKRFCHAAYERQELRNLLDTVETGTPEAVSWGVFSKGLPDAYLRALAEASGLNTWLFTSRAELLEEMESRGLVRTFHNQDRLDVFLEATAQYRRWLEQKTPSERAALATELKKEGWK